MNTENTGANVCGYSTSEEFEGHIKYINKYFACYTVIGVGSDTKKNNEKLC